MRVRNIVMIVGVSIGIYAQVPVINDPVVIYTSAQLDARITADPSYHVNNIFVWDCSPCFVVNSSGTATCLLSGQCGNDIYRGAVSNSTFLDEHVLTVADCTIWEGSPDGRVNLHRNFTDYTPPLDGEVGYIANVYVVEENFWIGFVHIERCNQTLKQATAVERNYAIGIAYSSNQGQNWRYQGDIIRPQVDPTPPSGPQQNIGGVPYLVAEDGGEKYFYVYYNEHNDNTGICFTAVARERISTVISMIQNNTVATAWKKYNVNNSPNPWSADGFTGAGTDVLESERYLEMPNYYYNYDMHTDAVYVKSSNVYILIGNYTKVIGGTDTVVETGLKYLQSRNGINWTDIKNIVSASVSGTTYYAFIHSSIMPIGSNCSADGSIVNDRFEIIFAKLPNGDISEPEVNRIDVRYPSILPIVNMLLLE